MKFNDSLSSRCVLVIRRRDGVLYYQIQYGVADSAEDIPQYYLELFRLNDTGKGDELGTQIINLLNRCRKHSIWTRKEVCKATGKNWENYISDKLRQMHEFLGVKTEKERDWDFEMITISYSAESDRYFFGLSYPYIKGSRYYMEGRKSTGKPGLLTFDTPLEFDSSILPEELGRMTLEAFERCQKLRDAANGNKFPKKKLTLLDESILEVQMPKDKHFSDSEDMGSGELYQVYEYFSKEDAEDSQAQFFLGIGAELKCDLSKENILAAWENYHGKAQFFEVQEVSHGIYSLRAELRNKNMHKISYFMPQSKNLMLECSMEVFQPGKRKKLDEKIVPLFEIFAKECKQ